MQLERYEVIVDDDETVFEFTSKGPKGNITKLVKFSETNIKNFYNLGFGDKDNITGEIDDTVITNNGDSRKTLATVAWTAYQFTEQYPTACIYAIGSTKARTRLYKMGISNNLTIILPDFEVYGLKNNRWIKFDRKKEYDAFLLRRRITKFVPRLKI